MSKVKLSNTSDVRYKGELKRFAGYAAYQRAYVFAKMFNGMVATGIGLMCLGANNCYVVLESNSEVHQDLVVLEDFSIDVERN